MPKIILILLVSQILISSPQKSYGQCADTTDIYSFEYKMTTYDIIRTNMTWKDAAACAVERGGYLAEINDQEEQDSLYSHLINFSQIDKNKTVAPDGGGASYVWIGGNDLQEEGKWVWDGDDDKIGIHFWQGTRTGRAIDSLYENWGNEPDDFRGQDGLGLAITDWPLGKSGQWNDIDHNNTLYFVVEHQLTTSNTSSDILNELIFYPNPSSIGSFNIINTSNSKIVGIDVFSSLGNRIQIKLDSYDNKTIQIELNTSTKGLYLAHIMLDNNSIITKQIVIR